MNIKKIILIAIILGFSPLTHAGSISCSSVVSDFARISKMKGEIRINPYDYKSYPKSNFFGGLPIEDTGSFELDEIIKITDDCTQEMKLERTRKADGAFRFSDEEKSIFLDAFSRVRSPLEFIAKFVQQSSTSGGLTLSCSSLAAYEIDTVAQNDGSMLFGKRFGIFTSTDITDIKEKLNQCSQLIDTPLEGVVKDNGFKSAIQRATLATVKWELALAKRTAEKKFADAERERKESFSYQATQWLSSAINSLGKLILLLGVILIAAASLGIVKRDRRFRTGRDGNKDDASWALPVGGAGFAVICLGGALMWLSGQ